jgi:hypothetical protein
MEHSSLTDPKDEELRESFEGLSAEMRGVFLALAHRDLADSAKERGTPEDVAVTPEAVYEKALVHFRRLGGDSFPDYWAGVAEFYTEEERNRMYVEEEYRLSVKYPEGVPFFVLVEAVKQRMQREHPEGDF